jgi:hypothetical protein
MMLHTTFYYYTLDGMSSSEHSVRYSVFAADGEQ